jgi:hypothetical protein
MWRLQAIATATKDDDVPVEDLAFVNRVCAEAQRRPSWRFYQFIDLSMWIWLGGRLNADAVGKTDM